MKLEYLAFTPRFSEVVWGIAKRYVSRFNGLPGNRFNGFRVRLGRITHLAEARSE